MEGRYVGAVVGESVPPISVGAREGLVVGAKVGEKVEGAGVGLEGA